MKILVYSANYAPEQTGIGKYSGEMATWLVRNGHEVRVIAAPPYYPHWEVAANYKGKGYQHEVIDGVSVYRAPLWVPKKPSGLTRLVHLMSFAVSSLPLALSQVFWKPDVVFTVAPAFVCAPTAWLTARLCNAVAWLHVQDFEVDVAFRLGLLKSAWMRRSITLLESWIFRRFDRVSSISNRMLAQARRKGVRQSSLVFFPNWVDIDHIKPSARGETYREELGLTSEQVVFLYSGSLGAKQGLQMIPEAAKRLKSSQIAVVICGDGVMKEQLQEACANMSNVRFLPLQPVARLGELLAMADVHLLPQSASAEDLVLPSKLSGMLASGRPVIATCHEGTELSDVVSKCGVVVEPENVDALAAAMDQLAASAEDRATLGARGRAYAEQYLATDSILTRFVIDLLSLPGERVVPCAPPLASRVDP